MCTFSAWTGRYGLNILFNRDAPPQRVEQAGDLIRWKPSGKPWLWMSPAKDGSPDQGSWMGVNPHLQAYLLNRTAAGDTSPTNPVTRGKLVTRALGYTSIKQAVEGLIDCSEWSGYPPCRLVLLDHDGVGGVFTWAGAHSKPLLQYSAFSLQTSNAGDAGRLHLASCGRGDVLAGERIAYLKRMEPSRLLAAHLTPAAEADVGDRLLTHQGVTRPMVRRARRIIHDGRVVGIERGKLEAVTGSVTWVRVSPRRVQVRHLVTWDQDNPNRMYRPQDLKAIRPSTMTRKA